VRELPPLVVRALRATVEIVVTTAALIWLVPSAAPLAIGLAIAVIAPPFVALGAMAERELRVHTHAGALSRYYHDALCGTLPARASAVEPALRREHEHLLVEWSRAARAEQRLANTVAGIQGVLGLAGAIALVFTCARQGGAPASLLLVAYWVLAIPATGALLTDSLRAIPHYRSTLLRLLEPLGALEHAAGDAGPTPAGAAAVELDGVSVVVGGHEILHDIALAIAPGEHVAVVGLSGGGKTTLLGLLLGWSKPSAGAIRVDGRVLDDAGITALRATTAWVDPDVTLWNESLASNLRYGAPNADIGALVAEADLESMLARLSEGLATRLGEAGGLVSGGEGQRVRLGRGFGRPAPRLVVLDEPCRGLDRGVRVKLLAAARRRWAASTLLCATHDLAETAAFPRVIVIEGGRIVEDGAPDELAARAGARYAELLAHERRALATWQHWKRIQIVDGRVEDSP
jgi:ATP-binding cassette subfamily B protein